MGSNCSLPLLHKPTTCSYPETDQCSPHLLSWRFILISSSYLCIGLPSGIILSRLPTKTLYAPLFSFICAMCPTLLVLNFCTLIIFCVEYKSWSCPLCYLCQAPICLRPKDLPQHPILKTVSAFVVPLMWVTHPSKQEARLWVCVF